MRFNQRKILMIVSAVLVTGLVVAACGGGGATATPRVIERTVVATPTAGPTPTARVVEQTVVVVATAGPTPTARIVERTVVVVATAGPTPTPAPTGTPIILIQTATATPVPGFGAATREVLGFRWINQELNWRQAPKRGGTHVYAFPIPSGGTDPILSRSFTVMAAVNTAYNQLFRCKLAPDLEIADINQCTPSSDLAISFEVSSDGRVWTLKLDPNATWQRVPEGARGYSTDLSSLYGRAVVADDIVHTVGYWQGTLTKPDGSPQGTPSSTAFAANIAEARAIDEKTVQFTLTNPDPVLPSTLSTFNARVVPPEVFNLDGDYTQRTVGSGAFILEKWDRTVEWSSVANPNFWRMGGDGQPLPYIDRHTVKRIGTDTARSGMITGVVDSALNVGVSGPSSAVAFARQCQSCQVIEFSQAHASFALGFRTEGDTAPFKDRRARLAIAKSIDYEALITNVHEGAASVFPNTNPWPATFDAKPTLQDLGAGASDDENPYIYNPELARELWAASGHSTGEKYTLIYHEYSSRNTNQSIFIASSISDILDIDVEAVKAANIAIYYTAVGFLGPPHQQFEGLAMYTSNVGTTNAEQPNRMSSDSPENQPQFQRPEIDAFAAEWSQGPSVERAREMALAIYAIEIEELRRMPYPEPFRYATYSGRLRNTWQQIRGGEMFHQGSAHTEVIWLDD